ncbi:hypothetical protein BELL_0935g00040 [Botrytis elliptica]|uniref:NACHT domain-containing protein n=1 Tax=Botrytis elliptica TaxID=278938 RepID=A0A4Z1IZF9_9HELO|nr:hypothetical protein EAE99_011932 [Botrytis elliptica]TGO66758.1 hypothetical protein BELL_0935g00040 [Botrytis elliptica]
MDPLTVLSIAGNVIQFVDFSWKLISGAQEIYRGGRLDVHTETKKVVEDLSKFSSEMSISIRSDGKFKVLTPNEVELEELCSDCSNLAEELVKRLETFQLSEGFDGTVKKRKPDGLNIFREAKVVWLSVSQVIKSMLSSSELKEMERKLQSFRDTIHARMLSSLRERVDQLLREQCKQTSDINRHMTELVESSFRDMRSGLAGEMQAQMRFVRDLIASSNSSAGDFGAKEDQKSFFNSRAQVRDNILRGETKLHERATKAVLKSLYFPTITARYETIAEAHKKTFEWIFKPLADEEEPKDAQWSDFVEWLSKGQGIYWINGKAASGKSTLMKFIYDHPKTKETLQQWAAEKPLYIAKFFFWWAGTGIQKSQNGLLRTLLFETLRQMPKIIPLILPSAFAMTYARESFISGSPHSYVWDTSSLSEAFTALVSQTEMPMKLCLFIDGLDEYQGAEFEIARLFKERIFSPDVKVCISSRPHIPFEDAFFTCPRLRLQDFTQKDFNVYVKKCLVQDKMMVSLAEREPEECQKLEQEIVNEAQGVFLWVVLVVRTLMDGLSKHDGVSELQLRLKALPKNLDELYEVMILKINDIYKEEASRLYQMVNKATEKPGDYRTAELLSVYTLYLANKQSINLNHELSKKRVSEDEVLQGCKTLDVALKARCGGILEIQFGRTKSAAPRPTMKVGYLHRTAHDFILKEKTWKALIKGTSGGPTRDAFNPNIAILKSMILQIKNYDNADAHGLINDSFTFIHRIEADESVSAAEAEELFDAFSNVAVAARYINMSEADHNISIEVELLMCLLRKHGRNPNEPLDGISAWQSALSHIISEYHAISPYTRLSWGLLIKAFLENRADPKACCKGPDNKIYSASEVIAKVFLDVRQSSPASKFYLERLMTQVVKYENSKTMMLLKAQVPALQADRVLISAQTAKNNWWKRKSVLGKMREHFSTRSKQL